MNNTKPPFKVLVVTSPRGIKDTQAPLLRDENMAIDLARLRGVTATLTENGASVKCKGKPVTQYDFVWLQSVGTTKDIAYMLSLYLDYYKIPHTEAEPEVTKLVDLFSLSLHNVSIPKTYFCSTNRLYKKLQYISDELGYPFLLKATVGWGGHGVHLVQNKADFFKIVPDLPAHKKYVCQKFIPNSFDYRIIVGNGAVLSGERRIRQLDKYRNNACLGAKEVFLPLNKIPQDVKDLAIKAASVCNLQWAGIDIMIDENIGKLYVLEVNRRPGLTRDSSEIEAAIVFLKAIQRKYSKG